MNKFSDQINLLSLKYGDDACWPWAGALMKNGYALVYLHRINGKDKRIMAHRRAYIELKGPIPNGLVLDHLCKNRSCVNPSHLEPVTQLENLKRGTGHAGKTHCKNGHEFTPENTRIGISNNGGKSRICILCSNAWFKTYRDNNKEQFKKYGEKRDKAKRASEQRARNKKLRDANPNYKPPDRMTPETIAKIIELRNQKMSQQKIADTLGITQVRVSRALIKHHPSMQ